MDTTYTNVVDASTSQIASDTKFHVAGLDLYYDKFHALKDINIDIPEKQITAFIGPSGCGKSTFLKSLNRMNCRRLSDHRRSKAWRARYLRRH